MLLCFRLAPTVQHQLLAVPFTGDMVHLKSLTDCSLDLP